MALTKERSNSVESSNAVGAGKKFKLGFAPGSEAELFRRLIHAYTDPIPSLVRELVSNAIDATMRLPERERSAVDIDLKTWDNEIVVKDYGIGMTSDEVQQYYNVGASIKKDDLNAIGSYGMGAKAPLAYSDEFTVKTTKHGVTTLFKISYANGEYDGQVFSERETGAPSGTEVHVPFRVNDRLEFEDAVDHYRRYSFDVSIRLNGQESDVMESDYVEIPKMLVHKNENDPSENVYGRVFLSSKSINDSAHYGMGVAAVLGGWAYSVDRFYDVKTRPPEVLVEIFPGLVDFSNSRDAITSNDRLEELNLRITEYFQSEDVSDFIVNGFDERFGKTAPIEFQKRFGVRHNQPNRNDQITVNVIRSRNIRTPLSVYKMFKTADVSVGDVMSFSGLDVNKGFKEDPLELVEVINFQKNSWRRSSSNVPERTTMYPMKLNDIDPNAPRSNVRHVYETVNMKMGNEGFEDLVIEITDVDENNMKTFRKARPKLMRKLAMDDMKNVLLILHGDGPKHLEKHRGILSGFVNEYKTMTVDEFEEYRKEVVPEEKRQSTVRENFDVKSWSPEGSIEPRWFGGDSSAIESGDMLCVTSGHPSTAMYGLENSGVEVVDRNVYFVDPSELKLGLLNSVRLDVGVETVFQSFTELKGKKLCEIKNESLNFEHSAIRNKLLDEVDEDLLMHVLKTEIWDDLRASRWGYHGVIPLESPIVKTMFPGLVDAYENYTDSDDFESGDVRQLTDFVRDGRTFETTVSFKALEHYRDKVDEKLFVLMTNTALISKFIREIREFNHVVESFVGDEKEFVGMFASSLVQRFDDEWTDYLKALENDSEDDSQELTI